MNGCIYRTEDNQCRIHSDPVRNTLSWCVGDNPCEARIPSNADRIREMTVKELAGWMWEHTKRCPTGEEPQECCDYAIADEDHTSCKQCWLSWLTRGADHEQ